MVGRGTPGGLSAPSAKQPQPVAASPLRNLPGNRRITLALHHAGAGTRGHDESVMKC